MTDHDTARERLRSMVRTDPASMTVWEQAEVDDALDAHRTEGIAKAIGRLRAVPVQCTALTGPVWYGQGWADAITTLEEIADYSTPDYEAYPGELVRLRALVLQMRAHVRRGNWDRVAQVLHAHSDAESAARAAAAEKSESNHHSDGPAPVKAALSPVPPSKATRRVQESMRRAVADLDNDDTPEAERPAPCR